MASIDRRSNGRWRARWREYPGGPQRSKHFARKADAERHLVQVQHDLLTGAYVDPARSRTTVTDFYRTWSARQPWRPSTRESVRTRFDNHVLPVLGARPLGSLRRGDVEARLAGRRLAPSTAGIALQQLSSMLEAAVADGLIARNPARGVRRPKVNGALVVPFTPEEIDRLIEAAARRSQWRSSLGRAAGCAMARRRGSPSTVWTSCAGSSRRTVNWSPAGRGDCRLPG